jgi:hypothetical protein
MGVNAVFARRQSLERRSPDQIMLDGLQPKQRADDLDHFFCTLPFTVKSKDESTT